MKVRFTARGVRVRIDDLELAALNGGEVLTLATVWAGGGWRLSLDPLSDGVRGIDSHLQVGVRSLLLALTDPAREGVTLAGPPRVDVQKDFGPEHG